MIQIFSCWQVHQCNGSTRGPKGLKTNTNTNTRQLLTAADNCCISVFLSHMGHITCICCICVYIGSGNASESLQQGSHSSFSPLNSTIHGVLFSAFYENSLPNNNKEYRHSICVPTYYHISLVIYWETQADGRCYFLADSFLYFLLLLILSVV